MKKTRRSIVCALLVIVFTLSFSVSALAAGGQEVTFVSGGLRYRVIDGGKAAEVVNQVSSDTKVAIPATADDLPVTAIGKSAFAGTPVTSVTLGDNVESIGVQAFQGCKSLSSVRTNVQNKVTSIGTSAFSACSALREAIFPAVTELGASAFQKCTSLSKASFPALTVVKSQTFHGCSALDSDNANLSFGAVVTVETGAFQNCSKIKDLNGTFHALRNVENSSFAGTGLTEIGSTPSIERIGESAFYGCTDLETINLPTSVQRIDRTAFGGCTALKNVTLAPGNLELIQEDIFSGTKFDPKTNGGLGYTAVINFGGTKDEWDEITRGKYSDYNVKCNDNDQTAWNPGVSAAPAPTLSGDPAPPQYSAGLVPELDRDWAKLSSYTPESGEEIKLITHASKGTISYKISKKCAWGSSVDYKILYPDQTIILDASNPGTGFQRSTYEIPITVGGRAGDEIIITLHGTYTNGSTSLPFSFELDPIVVQGTLRLTGVDSQGQEFKLINIGPADKVNIKAVIGPPPQVNSYSWTVKKWIDNGWKDVHPDTLSDTGSSDTRTFQPGAGYGSDEADRLKAVGMYRVTCTAKIDGQNTKTAFVEIDVREKTPKIYPNGEGLKNLQPGKSASLHMKWLSNYAPTYDSIEYTWSCYPNQNALSGNLETAFATFCATEPGEYTVTCTARITVKDDASRGYTTSDTIKISVYPYALRLTDGKNTSVGQSKVPCDVLTAGEDSRTIKAEWINQTKDAVLSPADGTVTYTWQCYGSSNGSAALKDAIPGATEVTFAPKVDGNYTVSCVSVWKPASGDGVEVKTVASIKYTVGRSIKILGADDTEVPNGKKFVTGQPISLKANVLPAPTDEIKWTVTGPDKPEPNKGDSFSFAPTKAGTYNVYCTVGSTSKSLTLSVADAVVNVSLIEPPDRIVVGVPVVIQADVNAIPGKTLDYQWTWTSGTNAAISENSTAGQATFVAKEVGSYSVTCTVRDKVQDGDKVKYNKLGSGSIKIAVLNSLPATTVKPDPEPELQLVCSTSSKKLSMSTDVTWTASWVNGFKDQDKLKQIAYYWYAEYTDGSDPAQIPLVPEDDDDGAGYVVKMGPGSNSPNRMGEDKDAKLKPGEYVIHCVAKVKTDDSPVGEDSTSVTDSTGKVCQADSKFSIFKSSVLTMSAAGQTLEDDGALHLQQNEEKGAVSCDLSVAWEGKAVPSDNNLTYTWTCDNAESGSVTGATISKLEGQEKNGKVRHFSTTEAGIYKVRCVGSGTGTPSDTKARTAELTIKVVPPESSASIVSEPANSVPAAPNEAVTDTQLVSLLKSDSKVSLSKSSAGTGVNVNGGVATGINRTGLTVGEVLGSFETSSDQSVAVTDRDGTVRSDPNGPVVTGDRVQICDASGSVIEEVPVVIMGDVIGTGQLSLSQVVTLAKELKNPGELEGPYLDAGDWNGNAAVNLSDIVRQASEMKAAMNS